jgi:hypothetical protein
MLNKKCLIVATLLAACLVDPLGAAPRRCKSSDFGIPQVATINKEVRQVWDEYNLKPSAPAEDGEWCRRVYLDIIGRIPTVAELKEFEKEKGSEKKADLVNKLLFDESYIEEYARNWTTIWTNILIGRSGGTERNSLTNRTGMQKYLRDSFARNRPYNDMVHDLVTATGSTRPEDENFNGAVNFLAMKVNAEDGTLATAATAKIFLGLQVQCTQCHNHPFNDWKQQTFWEFNAFFRQTRALRKFAPGTRDVQAATLVDQDFPGEDKSDPSEAAIYYELRNGLLRVAYPVFVDGTEVGRSGLVRELNRRESLGKLVLQSEYLDKTIVNRYWAHFLGYGFTKPIDDMGPHSSPTHPALLDHLGQELRQHSYNLKELIQWIVLSEPYTLTSKTNRLNEKDDPLLGDTPKFTHFYLQQMGAEELYESLLVATKASKTQGSYEEQERVKTQWLSQFVTAFGNDEGEESTTFNGSIPQALMMFNGELIRNATSADRGSFLWEIANSSLEPRLKIEYLFMAGLSRRPTRDEYDIASKLLLARAQDQVEDTGNKQQRRRRPAVNQSVAGLATLQDIWWAILNSNEFIINH